MPMIASQVLPCGLASIMANTFSSRATCSWVCSSMLFERRRQILGLRSLGHLGQRRQDFLLREVDVLERVVEQVVQGLRLARHGVLHWVNSEVQRGQTARVPIGVGISRGTTAPWCLASGRLARPGTKAICSAKFSGFRVRAGALSSWPARAGRTRSARPRNDLGTMPKTIGQPLRRKEDLRLVTGNGRYSDDVSLPGQAYAAILRSPHAHARIRAIDTAAARAMPGVLAVLTGADVVADGLKDIPHTPIPMKPPADILLVNRDGSPHGYAPQELLPTDRVRYVGQQVVMVVAETPRGTPRTPPSASRSTTRRCNRGRRRPPQRSRPQAPRLYDHRQQRLHRRRRRRRRGDQGRVRARGAHRSSSTPGCIASPACRSTPARRSALYDPATNRYTLHAGSRRRGAAEGRARRASSACRPADVRVECGDVGGNFGTRNAFFPEFALVVWAAKRLGRPVKWTCERSEAFASDYQGRDQVIQVRACARRQGPLPRDARLDRSATPVRTA